MVQLIIRINNWFKRMYLKKKSLEVCKCSSLESTLGFWRGLACDGGIYFALLLLLLLSLVSGLCEQQW